MSFWQWLGTPDGIPVLVAIVGLGSGVLGGIVAGVFKTHGDTKQINAANELAKAAEKRWEKEQEFERKQYLLEARRDAIVRFLRQADGIWIKWYRLSLAEEADRARYESEIHSGVEELYTLANEVALYDEAVGQKAQALLLAELVIDKITAASFNDMTEPWNARYYELRATMRRSLGIESAASSPSASSQSI